MTVSNVTIKPLPALKNWYKLTFTSRKDGIGETVTEMLVSEETLRGIRTEINQIMPMTQIPETEQWQLSKAFDEAAKKANEKDK